MTLKQETADIIAKFADKTLSFGCGIEHHKGFVFYVSEESTHDYHGTPLYSLSSIHKGKPYGEVINTKVKEENIIGHPVFIGTVLKKMLSTELHDNDKAVLRLTYLWENCGIDKSLNEIFVGKTYKRRGGGSTDNEVFMDDSVQALFEFIKTL